MKFVSSYVIAAFMVLALALMPSPTAGLSAAGVEVASLPFGRLIGGPLSAVVEAMAESSMTTLGFITALFTGGADKDEDDESQDMGTPILAQFTAKVRDENGTASEVDLQVPLLTIVPIPYFQIQEATFDFSCKIQQTNNRRSTTRSDFKFSGSGGLNFGFFSMKMSASHSVRKTTSSDSKFSAVYQYDIHIKATQPAMPEGMRRMLDILESAMNLSELRPSS